ncbi:hypothetical protein OG394_21865 [Kribbella sp. NBC_01245]|uniref:hypothetical protein n=1 Tax=Kribbella sp. NBC_01245 TaxID=2903578 RepID=UPI002E2A5DF8|nr:hypothetical protein [Kribbella sp. NBC_01245]
MTALSSAADLWRDLCETKKLRLKGYDQDLADTIRTAFSLTAREDIAAGLTRVDATAEALLRVMLASLRPFTEMLTDLLGLYARIDADTGTGDNLRIVYEFQQDKELDLLLSNFREEVKRTVTRLESVLAVQVTIDSPRFPLAGRAGVGRIPAELGDWVDQYANGDIWPTGIPSPPKTGIDDLDRAAAEAMEVFHSVLGRARMVSAGRPALAAELGEEAGSPEDLRALWMLVSEFWLLECVIGLHSALAAEDVNELAPDLTGMLRGWLDSLPTRLHLAEVRREVLESILSLPTWGFRHELYAAWVITEIDAALDQRLRFRVDNGRLAFPFHETLIAILPCAGSTLELWTELRSPLDNPVGKSRTKNIQPDYRFFDAAADDRTTGTPLAIEVKQYGKAANKSHGLALADYTEGLPNAKVILAAYGVVGPKVKNWVAAANRDRAIIVADLRPARPAESAAFRQAVIEALPPAPAPAAEVVLNGEDLTISLHWNSSVHDLDLHAMVRHERGTSYIYHRLLVGDHARLDEDARDGGPETLRITNPADEGWRTVEIWVDVYPHDEPATFADADPVLVLTGATETHVLKPPLPLPDDDQLAWRAATIRADGTVFAHGVYASRSHLRE